MAEFRYRGREVDEKDILYIRTLIERYPKESRRKLSTRICEAWQWRQANGALRDMVCRGMLLMLDRAGQITLPPVSYVRHNPLVQRSRPEPVLIDKTAIEDPLRKLQPLEFEQVRRREIDVVLVWRLDRWGRSVTDLLATLQELEHLGVGFVSLTEALDLTTPAGRAMAALLAVFAEFEREILSERVRAGLAHARANGKRLGRPLTAGLHASQIRKLHRAGLSKSEISRRLNIGRTSVRRILDRRSQA
jgi:hypothetical protein